MAEQSLAEANSAFLQARADRVSKAMTDALAGKLDPPGAAKRAKVASAPKAAAAPAASATSAGSTRVAPAALPHGEPSPVDAEATGLEPTEGEEAEAEAQGEPTEVEETEADPVELSTQLEELKAHGKKRDLRAIEKVLGLEEGSLGANNASWKAYRKRVGEVEARETKHVENEGILISKFSPAVNLIQHARQGNLKAYAALIEHTSGVPIAQFVAHWSKNVEQLDPRILELQQENAKLKAGGNLIETKAEPTAATATQKADEYIATEAKDHPAFKLEGAAEGIRKIWLASFKPSTKTFGLSPKAAANEFIKQKRAKAEQEQWILSGKKPPKKAAVTRGTPRTGSSETQVRKSTLTRQQLIERAANDWQRQKARDRRA